MPYLQSPYSTAQCYQGNVHFHRDVNTGFFVNWFSVVENWLQTAFQFHWPSQKFIIQARLNLVIFDFFGGHI